MRHPWLVLLVALGACPSTAAAWEPFRRENPDVREGNARMAAGEAAAALEAYDAAARSLPSEPGVHLDRGLALLAAGQIDPAREALRLASEPPAPAPIRAAALYNLGLAFYGQGDAASAEDHAAAQRSFREAADAFRGSLRQQPGNRDAAWNLELALRRIQEQQEQQEQQDQQDQQDQQQDPQDPQQDPQDPQQQDQQDPQDPQQQDQQNQQGQQDQQTPQDPQDQQNPRNQQGQQTPQTPQDPQGQQDPQQGPTPENPQEAEGSPERALPADARRVLDALRDGEENLERELARARGEREQRRVTQDW